MLGAAAVLLAVLAAGGSRAARQANVRVALLVEAGTVPTPRELQGKVVLGFLRAEKKLDFQGRIAYVGPNQDPRSVLESVARQDYDLIAYAFPYFPPVNPVAREFPRVPFLLIDAPIEALSHRYKNVRGTLFHAGQAAYLAGYLSALMESRRPGKHLVSAVGGIKFPGVTRWIIGFQAGARKADPHVGVRVDYSNDFTNPAKCRRLALTQIARGSGVVFNVAGACGIGAMDAAKQKHVWGVGVDFDQSFLGRHILTSAVIRTDNGVYDMIRRLVRGRLPPGGTDTVYNLRNAGVGLGRISSEVPPAFLRRLDSIRRQIIAGKIRVRLP